MAKAVSRNKDIGILLIRVAIGLVFLFHGWEKVTDLSGTAAGFAGIGIPEIISYGVSFLELLGGLALILGVWVKWVGILLAIEMLFAIILVKLGTGFVGGFEFELILLLISAGLAFTGPGAYALQKPLKKRR